MSDHQLSLPEAVYQDLLAAAAMEGVSPADWIAAHLPEESKYQLEPGDISDLIGSVDSRRSVHPRQPKTPFEEILIEKMAKQGVHIP